jgi:hypothetical protein
MNSLLSQQLDELLNTSSNPATDLQCEGALRVGAATLRRGAPSDISATTVVCTLSDSYLGILDWLVQEIADEYEVNASIQEQSGSCSVRFTLPQSAVPIESVHTPQKSVLARLLRR